ncbi:MAG: polysaccharide biosynthesis protein [Pseudomonadales bacterium]|nr:polysaccharide biosynthesis protein [Pseudomonadales bacterium]
MESKITDKSKRTIMMIGDGILLPLALWVSVALRYGDFQKDIAPFWWLFLVAAVTGVFSLQKLGLYRAVVRYIGPSSMIPVVQGVTVATIAISLTAYLSQAVTFPRSAPIMFWFISILMIGGSRIVIRAYFYGLNNNYLVREPIAIYGAGDSGAQLAITLLNGSDFMPVAFIDDNRALRKNIIHGIKVYDAAHIDRLVKEFGIKQIFLAVPSATAEQRGKILNKLAALPILIQTVPTFADIMADRAIANEVRSVDIADLLGRETVPPNKTLLESCIKGKSVLVTGAGGTIGSELCRKILSLKPMRLVLFDNSEISLYTVEHELNNLCAAETDIAVLLGSILNKSQLSKVMADFNVDTVYHAAAYKHVTIVEGNVIEGIRNNVLGSWNVVSAASDNRVKDFVLISSDKAVRPTNVMGATKRLAELIVKAHAEESEFTCFSMVRFGNVLRSSGSVVPLFEKQILAGGPVTVRHKDATRFFMTVAEAAELVIQAGSMAEGGELFVLDMGEPVNIDDLAHKMIHLHGKKVGQDEEGFESDAIEIEYVGLQPGEKLYEELIIGQAISGTQHTKIMMADEEFLSLGAMTDICSSLSNACDSADYKTVRSLLEKHVSGYKMHLSKTDPSIAAEQARDLRENNITPFVKKED